MMPFASKKTLAVAPRVDIQWTLERASDAFGEPHLPRAGERALSRSEMQEVSLDIGSPSFTRHSQSEVLTRAFRDGKARVIIPVGARLALNRARATFSYRMTLTLNSMPARDGSPLCLWRANRDGAIARSAQADDVEVNSLYEERIALPRFPDLAASVTHLSVTVIYLVTLSSVGSCVVVPTPLITPLFEVERSDSDRPPASGLRHLATTMRR